MIFSDLGTTAPRRRTVLGLSLGSSRQPRRARRPGQPDQPSCRIPKSSASSGCSTPSTEAGANPDRIVQTMGTGINAQQRLKALHHLDVPSLPSQIEQREGRIERQGNEHDEIEIYAYATKRSVDATGWQILERKARFIDAAMAGDRSVRRIEDAGSQANQFALAKAIASGDRTAHAQGRDRLRDRAPRTPARQPLRRPARNSAARLATARRASPARRRGSPRSRKTSPGEHRRGATPS